MKFVVAIDGTAASGKGTLGKKIANYFGFNYLDTGILYRIIAYNFQSLSDFSKITKEEVMFSLKLLESKRFKDIDLRNDKISLKASLISKNINVRNNLLDYQREFANQEGGTVLDGRDIGTVVCPDADVKIFVDAEIHVRAERRYNQLSPICNDLSLRNIFEDLNKRDKLDRNRKLSPMVAAKDALILDTTNLTIKEGTQQIISIISKKLEKLHWIVIFILY